MYEGQMTHASTAVDSWIPIERLVEVEGENYCMLTDRNMFDEREEDLSAELGRQYEALSMQIGSNGYSHPNTAIIFNSIGRQFVKLGEYHKALLCFMSGMDLRKDLYGERHSEIAASYNFIAGAYYLLEDYSSAVEWLMRELRINEDLLGKDHPETKMTYEAIAKMYERSGQNDKAKEWDSKVS